MPRKIIYNPVAEENLQYISDDAPIQDTKANILALTPTVGLTAYATDTKEWLVANGSAWNVTEDPTKVLKAGDNLEGNLTADVGVLIDGYDISVEFESIDTGIDGGTF